MPAWTGVRGFVDLHSHALHALDDGPASLEESVALAAAAWRAGTAALIATPHLSFRHAYDVHKARRRMAELEGRLPAGMSLFRGCELELNDAALRAFRSDPRAYSINGSRRMLVELPPRAFLPSVERALLALLDEGFQPIVAHPERNSQIASQLGRLAEWARRGCFTQVTASALTGGLGRRLRSVAEELLREGLVDFVASDAHDSLRRGPRLIEAYRAVAEAVGLGVAARLFTYNPLAVLHDETVERLI